MLVPLAVLASSSCGGASLPVFACPPNTTPAGGRPPEYWASWCERSDGSRHGPLHGFDEHGHLVYVGGYDKGAWHGDFIAYGDEGEVLGKFEMVHGTGPFRMWHQNGKLRQQGQYRRSRKFGPWISWYESGQLALEASYDGGLASGTFKWWSKEGVLLSEMTYERGDAHGLAKTFDNSGALVEENHYVHGARTRVVRYEDGKIVSTEEFELPASPIGTAVTRSHPLIDANWQSCAADQDCHLVALTCCPCGAADYVATNELSVSEAKASLEAQATCARTNCPAAKCETAKPRCDDGRCVTIQATPPKP